MQPKQLAIVITAVALLSAGLGVVVTSAMRPKEVKVSLDIGGGRTLDLSKVLGDGGDLERARISANENAAIATLRSIASAQELVQSVAAIDADADGNGEYAYFGEMAGAAPVREFRVGSVRSPGELMAPPVLSSAFGNVSPAGTVARTGYLFRIFLPGATVGGRTPGLPEGSHVEPDPDAAEILWCAYAWPAEAGVTGNRTFFISHEGELTAAPNDDGAYSGEDRAPAFDAALSSEHPGDMASLVPSSILGQTSNDGRAWAPVGY